MEVDKPAPKDEKSEEPGQSTSHVLPDESETTDGITEEDWLVAFEGMPELDDAHTFYIPVGSLKHH